MAKPPLLFLYKERGHKIIQGRDKESELMLDYLRLSPMIGGGSLSLKANERTTKRESERAQWREKTARQQRKNQRHKRKQAALLAGIALVS